MCTAHKCSSALELYFECLWNSFYCFVTIIFMLAYLVRLLEVIFCRNSWMINRTAPWMNLNENKHKTQNPIMDGTARLGKRPKKSFSKLNRIALDTKLFWTGAFLNVKFWRWTHKHSTTHINFLPIPIPCHQNYGRISRRISLLGVLSLEQALRTTS